MTHLMATLCAVSFLIATDGPSTTTPEESRKLQGSWTVVRARRDGEVDNELVDATLVVSGDKFTSKSGMRTVAQGNWKLDADKKPRTIDIEYTEGPEKGQTARGIYSITDGTWILLLNAPGRERPASFSPESEIGLTYLILKPTKP